MNRRIFIVWAYVVEWLAAGGLLLLLCHIFGENEVASFMQSSANDVAAIFGVGMLTASIGFLWAFYSKADTPFYTWLNSQGALGVFLNATAYVVVISLFATSAPLVLKIINNKNLAIFVVFVELLAIINFYSLIKNALMLTRLNVLFNQRQS